MLQKKSAINRQVGNFLNPLKLITRATFDTANSRTSSDNGRTNHIAAGPDEAHPFLNTIIFTSLVLSQDK